MATFAQRIAASGVVRSWDFSTSDQLGDTDIADNVGYVAGTSNNPAIDLTTPAHTGGGSLKFTVPGLSGLNAAGEWWSFSTDLATRFGENDEFWVQWRERKNSAMCTVDLTDPGGGTGIKTLILGHQNGTNANPGSGSPSVALSSDKMKLVVQTYQHTAATRFPHMYRYRPSDQANAPLHEDLSGNFGLQNYIPSPFCRYLDTSGCLFWIADQWDTYTLHVKLGAYDEVEHADPCFLLSEAKLYIQRPGESRQLAVYWRPGIGGYEELQAWPSGFPWEYGKLWFGPYITNKVAAQNHADMILWISDVIVSSQDIAIATDDEPSALETLLAGLDVGEWGELTTTNIATALGSAGTPDAPGASESILGYTNSMAWDPITEQFFVCASDHYGTSVGNDVKLAVYAAMSNAWRNPATEDWVHGVSHGYDNNAVDPIARRYYTHQPAHTSNLIRAYNIDLGTWSTLAANTFQDYGAIATALRNFPGYGLVWIQPGTVSEFGAEVYRWNGSAWSEPATNVTMGGYAVWACYSPVANLVYFGGGSGDAQKLYQLNSSGTVTQLNNTPVGLGTTTSIHAMVVADPVDPYLHVFASDGSRRRYNISGDTWTTIDAAGTNRFDPILQDSPDKAYGCVAGIADTYGALCIAKWYPSGGSKFYVLKLQDTAEEETTHTRSVIFMN